MSVQQQLQRALFETVRLRYFQAATPACTVCAPRKNQAKFCPYIVANVWPFRNSMLPLCRHSKRSQPPMQPSADSATNQRCFFARHSKLMRALQQARQVCWLLVPPKNWLMSANTCLPRPRAHGRAKSTRFKPHTYCAAGPLLKSLNAAHHDIKTPLTLILPL